MHVQTKNKRAASGSRKAKFLALFYMKKSENNDYLRVEQKAKKLDVRPDSLLFK